MTARRKSYANQFRLGANTIPAAPLTSGLYVVSTPIGNLSDITIRALETLAGADRIACEDRRVTGKLLKYYGIARPLVSYHDHTPARGRVSMVQRLRAGESLALVSDAGTPLISDPGYKLIADCVAADIPVVAIPGASSPMAALSVAGLPTDQVLFAGFPSPKAAARKRQFTEFAHVRSTLVFMESPNRVAASLADMAACLGAGRSAAVCRELTKLHETVTRGSLGELATAFAESPIKGEIVVVVGPPAEADLAASLKAAEAMLQESLTTMSARDAVQIVAGATGISRKTLYKRALALQDRQH